MQLTSSPKFILLIPALCFVTAVHAQLRSVSYSCTKDTFIDCSQHCITLKTQIPDIRSSTANYVVNKTSEGGCFRQYVSPDLPQPAIELTEEDSYSSSVPIPFDFPFYDFIWTSIVFSTNGAVSFDVNLANTTSSGSLVNEGVPQNLPSRFCDRATIMGVFQDMSSGGKIKYDIIGIQPNRKIVFACYNVPLNGCSSLNQNTYQLVLHEGTGMVEVFVNTRQTCTQVNQGKAMIGMQNYARNKAIMAPGRTAADDWGSIDMNESWRFTPASGAPLFKKTELYTIDGTYIATGDTVSAGNGVYNVSFSNICTNTSAQYIVQSSYRHFIYFMMGDLWPTTDVDSIILVTDTIRIIKNAIIPDIVITNANCSTGAAGIIQVVSPLGVNYEFSIDGGNTFQSSPFFSVFPGMYNLTVRDNAGGCTYDTLIIVNSGPPVAATVRYPKSIYCNSDTATPLPSITGTNASGIFTANPQGLLIDNNTGEVTITGSDTGFYTITFHPAEANQCTTAGSTTVRIVDQSEFTWTGAVDTSWENAGNWSCNAIPGSTSHVFIYSGTVVINSNVTIKSLTVSPGASVTVSPGNNLTVLQP